MSCGTKITGRSFGYWEQYELADKVESEVGYFTAQKIRHGDCLDSRDLRAVEDALEHQGMSKYYDYREESCHCRAEDESEY